VYHTAQGGAQVDGRWIEGQATERRPQFDLVAIRVATMAVVPSRRHVHREARRAIGGAVSQRTTPVPLVTTAAGGLEAEQLEGLLHCDLGTYRVKIRTRHEGVSPDPPVIRRSKTEEGPFRSHDLYRERGTQNSSHKKVVPIGSSTVPQPISERQMRNWRFVAIFAFFGPDGPINLARHGRNSSRQGECGASSAGHPPAL
jgi:hypothetical protein